FLHLFRIFLSSSFRAALVGSLRERSSASLTRQCSALSSGVHQARSFLVVFFRDGTALSIADWKLVLRFSAALSISAGVDRLVKSSPVDLTSVVNVSQSVQVQIRFRASRVHGIRAVTCWLRSSDPNESPRCHECVRGVIEPPEMVRSMTDGFWLFRGKWVSCSG